MAFSQSVIDELRRELQVIENERKTLDFRANAIKQLLGEQVPDQPTLLPPGEVIWTAPRMKPDTFKGCVKQILAENPGGVRVTSVTHILRRRGWLPHGSTDLGHRVYNEIWRMAKAGEVRKTEDGGYELA